MSQHPIQRRYLAEDLVRARRSDEARRYAASQRQGRIDPNPHQIDAVVFALQRLREGGCILADEVGLGKTIEAGLVIAQLLAESAQRVLVILPKALMGQWQNELFSLFGIIANEVNNQTADFSGTGVFLVGREFAGGESGSELITSADPFDLCVIDEAHEIFSGIYKRFGRDGLPKSDSREAMTAYRVRSFLGPTPVLLLTATPIQNSLAELWGLVQYVEPTQTLLGALPTFRDLFCEPGSNDRRLITGQAGELRKRINAVCQRTLRRQAQDFLERKFTARRAMLFEYEMTAAERSLYDGVTEYLLQPELCAFSGKSRQLLLIGFHRRMASSFPALISSLEKVAARLNRMLKQQTDETYLEMLADLELESDELGADTVSADDDASIPPERIAAELELVEDFIAQGKALDGDAKAASLISAIQRIFEQQAVGDGSGKVVIFTESCTTQDYLREVLIGSSLGLTDEDITLFRGENSSARARQAYATWQDEVSADLAGERQPSTAVGTRLALVHEFKTRSRVFISTEAGAKGLNLQFCDTIVNFDLPWNPQRIEQRIGRCHRYSQLRDVTVINFIASDNEAQRLTFEILSEKLDLFGEVLDASDVILHEPQTDAPELLASAFGSDIETRLQQIYDMARSQEELSQGLKELSSELQERRRDFEATQERMDRVIESRFDDSVKAVFRRIAAEIPQTLAELDRDTERVLVDWLDSEKIPYSTSHDTEERRYFDIEASTSLPEGYHDGARVTIGSGRGLDDREPLFIGHPLLRAAVACARRGFPIVNAVEVQSTELADRAGQRGRMILVRMRTDGFECEEHLLPIGIVETASAADPELLEPALAGQFLTHATVRDCEVAEFGPPIDVDEDIIDDLIEETLFLTQQTVAQAEQERFETFMGQLERYADDQAMLVRRELAELREQLEKAQSNWETSTGADARTRAERAKERLEQQIEERESRLTTLENRTDEHYQRCRERAYERRYAEPVVERLFDVEFVIR